MIAALLAAASLATPACAATPVHRGPLPQSGSLSALRWVQAEPHRAGIVGMLFAWDDRLQPDPAQPTFALWAHGVAPGPGPRASMKVLWIIRNVHATGDLVVQARRLDGRGSWHAQFSRVFDASAHPAKGTEFASIVKLPSAGCWQLDVRSASVHGRYVVRAVEP
jgi:hypothetical protein